MPLAFRLGCSFFATLALASEALSDRGRTIETTAVRLQALGLEGGRLFWVLEGCTDVFTRPLPGGRVIRLGRAAITSCDHNENPQVAFAGRRALWVTQAAGNSVYANVLTAAPGERPRLLEEVVGASGGGDGDYLTDTAGGDGTILYAVVSISMLDTCIDPGTPCDHSIASSRVMRVVGRRAVRIPGMPPALRLAAGGGRVAIEVAAEYDGQKLVSAGRVEVRSAVRGRPTARIRPDGTVLELAVSRDVLVVLVRKGGRKYIERYSPRGGLLGRTAVYGNSHSLAVSGRRVVFATGRTIREIAPGATGIVAVAARRVVVVAVEGGRLVWAENDGRRSRIALAEL